MKLEIELVPKSSWYSNVRSKVSKNEWDLLRKKSYRKANYHCEICGGIGAKHPVECHEIWKYDDKKHIQKLTGLISLCPTCHKVKHAGLAQRNGEIEIVINQLMKVNNINRNDAKKHIKQSFKKWSERSLYEWDIDTSILNEEYENGNNN